MNKSTFVIFLLVCFCTIRSALAQGRLAEAVDFSCRNCAPADALVQLSRQTGINIAFSDRFFNRCPSIDIEVRSVPLSRVLEQISDCANVSFKYDGAQVVFFRKNQKYTLSGYVQDAETGERLIGASIRAVSEKNIGTASNEYGFFSLRLDEGECDLTVSYIGYRQEKLSVDMQRDRLIRFQLHADNNLPEVVISDQEDPEAKQQKGGSPKYLAGGDLKSLPMPGGEADLLRQTALQPGVQTGVDGLGGLHIRGGNADHNLFLLDDVPVYSPSHALGLFSIYNPSMVKNVRLWKGDFPARYGGRVASVLDVRTRDGNFRDYHASVSAGLFASSAAVEGPLVRDRSSFLLGVRTTYLGPWVDFFSKKGNLLTFSGDRANYRFYDANLKINYVLSDQDRIYFSYYSGGDRFRNNFIQLYNNPDALVTDRYNITSDWGNAIAALRWNHLLSKNLFTNTTLRYSRFIYDSQLTFNSEALYPSGKYQILYDYAQLYQTLIRDISGKTDFSFFISDRLTLRWGFALTQHNFQPGALSVNFQLPGQSPTAIDSLANILQNNERITTNETEAYFDSEFEPLRHVHVETGLNGSVFQGKNVNYRALQPRLRIRVGKSGGWNVWGGYHQMSQYLHQIGSFNVSLPFELWVPSTQKVQPEKVRQFSAGISWQKRGWAWQAEVYDKNLDRVFTFLSSNDALFTGGAEDASGWEDRIASGTGRSKGLEVVLEKNTGSATGSIAYTFSKTTRTFPEVNSGREFLFRFDRPHDLKITLQQRLSPWLDASAIWAFATGNPITLTGVKYTHESVEGEVERQVFVYTEVNGYRLPNYHRLDLALNMHFTGKRFRHNLQLGVYNVYNRANPFYLSIDTGSEIRGKAIQYTLLPLLPVFRYEIKI
ncbi:MAG TPA: TonB-dependent receptor [Saprospiraceae bacterium]|nr:TonB-dependent receptor [Saprospiraceae bacterium]